MSQDSAAPAAPTSPIQGLQTPEVPKVETPATDPKQDFLAPKFAALTRKEKQVREYERSLKMKEQELQAKYADFESKSKASTESQANFETEFKKNPLKTMEKYGITFEQLAEMQLNDQNPTTEMQMAKMRQELEAQMEEKYGKLAETIKEKETREAQQAYDNAVAGYKSEISTFINQNSDKYELIAANGATELMYETAEAFYKATEAQGKPRVPDMEELAQAVEAHLEDQANQIFKLKKFQKLQPEASKGAEAPKTAPTLSNTLSAEVPQSGTKQLSNEESKRNAAKLLRWNSN